MKRYILIIIFFIALYPNVLGQKGEGSNYFFETNYQYGFVWQHRPSIESILGGNINVLQLNIGKETYGQTYWDQLYRYPDWGAGFYCANLGNNEEMGMANAIYGYINVPLFLRKKFEVRYNISGGLAYLTKGNVAIGTHLNLYFDININTRIPLSNRLYLVNAFGATHFSNGAMKMPNLGLNLFSYRLGIHYQLSGTEPKKIENELPLITQKKLC
ncbi:MAG: acyloxyacyl hydrolase [Bacteroidota bacterium]|nr:acyloxyacyl hydrolase [Bacteroidota bacterium]